MEVERERKQTDVEFTGGLINTALRFLESGHTAFRGEEVSRFRTGSSGRERQPDRECSKSVRWKIVITETIEFGSRNWLNWSQSWLSDRAMCGCVWVCVFILFPLTFGQKQSYEFIRINI